MAIRRSRLSFSKKEKQRREWVSRLNRDTKRERSLERLEDRHLMAGAKLIGIQPDDGALLRNNDTLNVAPADLTFRFDESQNIDPASLGTAATVGGIQITRSGLDGVFAPAKVSPNPDFGTAGAVVFEFAAVRLGVEQNGIQLTITKSDFGGPGLPGVSVIGRTININLNVNQDNETTALDLINAINKSAAATNLISARIVGGTSPSPGAVKIANSATANSSLVLTGANDVVVHPGFIGVSAAPATNEVIFRFAETPPDDHYRIDIFGTGATPLKNTAGEPFQSVPVTPPAVPVGKNLSLNFELDLAPQIVAVVPQPISRMVNGSLTQDRNRLVVYFNNDNLNVASVRNRQFYQLVHTNDTLENTDDVVFNPTDVEYDSDKDLAVLNFGQATSFEQLLNPKTNQPVGPGTFRLRIGTDEILETSLIRPNASPAPPVVSTPQSLATALFQGVNVQFVAKGEHWGKALTVEVFHDQRLVSDLLEVRVLDNAISVAMRPGATVTAQDMVDALNNHFNAGDLLEATILSGNPAAIISGRDYAPVTLKGLGSSFDLAWNMNIIGAQNQIVQAEIEPHVFTIDLPGGNDDPGHREFSIRHIADDSADSDAGITRIEYNFRADIGFLPDGRGGQQPAFNIITAAQKRRAREAMQILSDATGVNFVETERDGWIIASGDPLTFNPNQPLLTPIDVNLDDRFNGSWFRTAIIGIGSSILGLGPAWELPGPQIQGPGLNGGDPDLVFDNPQEPIVLSDNDIVHLNHLFRPESKDIDMYRFELQETGTLNLETYAERLLNASELDTALTLYRENTDGSRELIARNDNFYSRDSFIEIEVTPGVYYVGVSASGNTEYDPTIEDTGFYGVTQGEYELRFNFRPDADNAIFDADNPNSPPTFLDGDADGVPGGVYDFWFKSAAPTAGGAGITPRTIYVDKSFATNTSLPMGTITNPFNNIGTALGRNNASLPSARRNDPARSGDLVRIVGNAGADGNISTLTDNQSYQIGFNSLGAALPDGSTMEVPQGVTVMIDAGAVFQLRRARIGVGSSAAGIDRSAGSLQVLGAPLLLANNDGDGRTEATDAAVVNAQGQVTPGSVYFTSYNDRAIGLDTNPFNTDPAEGDWGGLLFRDDIDRSEGNFVYDEEGIFLNYVNHADLRYGGGSVLINSVATVINPIHITDTRPTITHNRISVSADAAMSASPDSFEETNFHAPRHQRVAFTSDYQRSGPDIHDNQLIDNSVNGLFIRVATEAGSLAQKLNVSGRWDDTDIVHVVSENFAIASRPGGVFEQISAPPIVLVTTTPAADSTVSGGGTLGTPGVNSVYSYKLTNIDRFGYEGPVSNGITPITLSAADVASGRRSIYLNQLPPAAAGFVARRLYRSVNNGPYELVTQLNGRKVDYLDNGKTRGGVLHVPPVLGVTLAARAGGALAGGIYNYKVTFVNELGKESRPSDATSNLQINGNPTVLGLPGNGTIEINGIPEPNAAGHFVAKRVYRSAVGGAGPYTLVQEINLGVTSLVDDGNSTETDILDQSINTPQLDARLSIDPNIVVKADGARFELELGAQMIAEGDDGREVIFTSIADDRYGAGGTFDTGNDGAIVAGGPNDPQPGDWGGIYAGYGSRLNVDHSLFSYGGGVTRIEGTFTAFNTIEVHEQATARIANSVFELNARGQGGQGTAGDPTRVGRGFNSPGVIFVRQAQPAIVDNVFRNNEDVNGLGDVPAININVNALNSFLMRDTGRTTGEIDRVEGYRDNRGPLVLDNRLDNNDLNGMVVRGQTVTTRSVWDDTSITHVVLDTIYVSDFHTYGGLTIQSSPTESLVVKLQSGNPAANDFAGFVATGIRHEIDDRIGGIIQIVGQPGSPVVLTSLADDTAGAGVRPDGDPQVDTNNDGIAGVTTGARAPAPGDWNSIRFDRFSHDRNVELFFEQEPRDVNSPGPNATPDDAQLLGLLSPREFAGDENRRLGFTVNGFLNDALDQDVFSFKAIPQTEVWIDIDESTHALDAVIEVLDSEGVIVARSDNSYNEVQNAQNLLEPRARNSFNLNARELAADNLLFAEARLMQKTPPADGKDFYGINPRDPGLRLLLPGIPDPQNPDTPRTYHVRVRSASLDVNDPAEPGLTSGAYQMQIRLRELQEVAGSTVRFARISFATNGVEVFGQPIHSPLTGEAVETVTPANANETFVTFEDVGNLLISDRAAISVAGILDDGEDGNAATRDVDFFEFRVLSHDIPVGQAIDTIFDIDYADGLDRPNTVINVFSVNANGTTGNLIYTSRDSNLGDDRPAPLGAADTGDLSRGTVGAADPFIGTVSLAEGRYRVAISADWLMPAELDQFFLAVPTNPLVRLEPIESVRRVADDHIDFTGGVPADPPQTSRLINPDFFNRLEFDNEVDYHLGDVVLFLSRDGGLPGDPTSTTILTHDPFTGAFETRVGAFGFETEDLAMDIGGELRSYSVGTNEPGVCGPTDANSGIYVAINPGNGAATVLGDDLIETYMEDPTDDTMSIISHICPGNTGIGWGIQYNAIAFGPNQQAYAIGNRGDVNPLFQSRGPEIFDNILYQYAPRIPSPQTAPPTFPGNASSAPNPNRVDDPTIPETLYEDAGTQIRERGEMLTSPRIEAISATQATPVGQGAISNIRDGQSFTVVDGATRVNFEFDSGPEVYQNINVATGNTIRDGNFFQLDQNLFQLDTGLTIVFQGGLNGNTAVTVQDTGGRTASYEFRITPEPNPAPPPLIPGATAIPFLFDTDIALAGKLAAAVNADARFLVAGVRTLTAHAIRNRVVFENEQDVQTYPDNEPGILIEGSQGRAPILQAVDGSRIVDGHNFILETAGNNNQTAIIRQAYEFDSGYMLHTPVRFTLQVPASGGRGIDDGEMFTVTNGMTSVTFEFDRDGVNSATDPAHVIRFAAVDTADTIATAMVNALSNPALGLGLAPSNLGGGLVHLGTQANNTLDTNAAPGLISNQGTVPTNNLIPVRAAGITDGEIFRISNGVGLTVNFEFDSDGRFVDTNNDMIPDNRLIVFNQADTHDAIANRIAIAVGGAGLGLTPQNVGNGNVHIGGDDGLPVGSFRHTMVTNTAPSLLQSGTPGLTNPVAIAIPYVPATTFTAANVVTAMAAAIQANASAASTQTITAVLGNQYADGQPLIVNRNGVPVFFEFNDQRFDPLNANRMNPAAIVINFDPGNPNPGGNQQPIPPDSVATMRSKIFNAVSNALAPAPPTVTQNTVASVFVTQFPIDVTTQIVNDRIVVNGKRIRYIPNTAPLTDLIAIQIDGVEEAYGVQVATPPQARAAIIEEEFNPLHMPNGRDLTDHFIATRVADVLSARPEFPNGVGGALNRINFPDAMTANFAGVPAWAQVATSSFGVATGSVRVPFLADDQPRHHFVDYDLNGIADDLDADGRLRERGVINPGDDEFRGLASKLAIAITAGMNFGSSSDIVANATGKFARLTRGSIVNNSGLPMAGAGPGGQVTGATFVGNTMYLVSDQGGLYQVLNPRSANATTQYIDTSEEDLLGINFSGLTTGPPDVEDGRYAQTLFATNTAGRIFAFNTAGELQPLFLDGQTSISTGFHPTEIRGLAFSTLDENLFQITPGVPRVVEGDLMDLRLGYSTPANPNVVVNYRDFDLGHQGPPIFPSNSIHFGRGFADVTPSGVRGPRSYDFPGGAHGSIVSNEFSLKGYAAADRPTLYYSYWLDTENASSAPGPMRDAFRVFIAGDDGDWELLSTNNEEFREDFLSPFDVQESFDQDQWRQVRIELDQYAGRENLRLRFDFSTAADMAVGEVFTTGSEVRTVAGTKIDDGDSFAIDGQIIEFESGLTLVTPTGAAIQPGEQITVTDALDNRAIFQFVNNVLTTTDIIATDGSNLRDGDTFQIDDDVTTPTTAQTFEFDSGYVISVPAAGGSAINDMETFQVDVDGPAGFSLPVTFEFDKNGIVTDIDGTPGPDNQVLNIIDNLTLIVPALGSAGLADQQSFAVSRGAQRFTFEFDSNGVLLSPFNLPIDITNNLTILLPAQGGGFGGVGNGDSFTIDPDGAAGPIPPIVFEFNDGSTAPFGNEIIPFQHFTTQDVLADRVVTAINNQVALLKLNAKNLGGGQVVLDGTTRFHVLDTFTNAPTVNQGITPQTQDELAARIIRDVDRADGLLNGNILGLTPTYDDTTGHIVFGGTTPQHMLDVNGIGRTTTSRDPNEVADRIASAINARFSPVLLATNLGNGSVQIGNTLGLTDHVVDTASAPSLTLTGTPGVTAGNLAVPFLPTDTVQDVVDALLASINGSSLNVLATQAAFPNEEVVVLSGTIGNQVAFSSGVTALEPRGIIPIYVDASQTANDVAERVSRAIQQAVARGDLAPLVVTHLNDDLGYELPSTPPAQQRLNRINLEGVIDLQFSRGTNNPLLCADPALRTQNDSVFFACGTVGLNDPVNEPGNLLVPIHTDMNRDEVANSLDSKLEPLFHNETIITEDGFSYVDGDTFVLSDSINAPVTYEFDSGYIVQIPPGGGMVSQGGIEDGDTIRITDASGTVFATFEFDKDNRVQAGNRRVAIRETDGAIGVAQALINAIQGHPLRVVLGLTPRFLTGNRVQIGGAVGTTLTLSPGTSVTAENTKPGVSPAVTLTLPQTLAMQLADPLTLHVPAFGIVDGETFTINDGIVPPVVFEFEDLSIGNGTVAGNSVVQFIPGSSQEEIALAMLEEINTAGLNVSATVLGGVGNIDLGGGGDYTLTLPANSRLIRSGPLSVWAPVLGGAAIVDHEQFTISNGPTPFTFEFVNQVLGSTAGPGRIPIQYNPADSRAVLADKIVLAIANTPGLGLNPIATTGAPRVNLGMGTNLTVNTTRTHLSQTGVSGRIPDGSTFVLTNGARVVRFEFDYNNIPLNPTAAQVDVFAGSTNHQIASEIIAEINRANLGLLPQNLGNGRIHVGGTVLHQLDTSAVPGLTTIGQGGPIADGDTFIIAEADTAVRFEFDKNGSWDPDNIAISIRDTDTLDTVAASVLTAFSPVISGLNIFPSYLGNGVIDLGGNETHTANMRSNLTVSGAGFLNVVAPAKGGGIAGVVDGEVFQIINNATGLPVQTYEFDSDGIVLANTVPVFFDFTDDQNDIARAIVDAVKNDATLSFAPRNLGNGLVDLGGSAATYSVAFPASVVTATGMRGGVVPHVRVQFAPSEDFFASDVANSISAAVNGTLRLNIDASVGQFEQRRVELQHTTGFSTDVVFTSNVGNRLRLEDPVDIVKQDEDLIRVIGHTITDAGPLGFDDALDGDILGNFHSNLRGQNNVFEGVYIDDIIIGFTERGERVIQTNGALGFVNNPVAGGSRTDGEYQLEIRQGPEFEAPLFTAFDTNDRQSEGFTLVVQKGLDIADGQTFVLSDGVEHVTFEYVDRSIVDAFGLPNQPQPGRLGVFFTPADTDFEVAQAVRDAINSRDSQAVLDVVAAIDDGTINGTGTFAGGGVFVPSTSGRVNLYGPVSLRIHATDIAEVNDTIVQATDTRIVGVDSPSFLGAGEIGDNVNFPLKTGFDVDLFKVSLAAGEMIRIDVDASVIGSELDAVLRVFDAAGNPVIDPLTGLPYFSDNTPAPGEYTRLDPYLEFIPPVSGAYYIGVSGGYLGVAPNDPGRYDPNLEGSGTEGDLGFYDIEITFGASTGNDYVQFDERGDHNLFRDQGQILIHGNTITDSSQYGVVIDAGARDGLANEIPHAGPVRYTPKLNNDLLATGVVVSNNVITHNATGGIRISGDANPGTSQSATVPFGRIINNTIFGGFASGGTTTLVQFLPINPALILQPNDDLSSAAQPFNFNFQFFGSTFNQFFVNNNGNITFTGPLGAFTASGFPQGTAIVAPFWADVDTRVFPNGTAAGTVHLTRGVNPMSGNPVVQIDWVDVGYFSTQTAGNTNARNTFTLYIEDDAAGDIVAFRYGSMNWTTGDASGGSNGFGGTGAQLGFDSGDGVNFISLGRPTDQASLDAIIAGSPFVFRIDPNTGIPGGAATGAGITIENNAGPTLLNNIIAGLQTGISVDASSAANTVIGGTIYQSNNTLRQGFTAADEDFAIELAANDPLFRNASIGNFYLERLSQAIDSSVGSLLERFDFEQVKDPLQIAVSPILAPDFDVTGQLRVDDPEVETPNGFGDNVFVDRGAIDRSDFVGPTASVVNPRDNDSAGVDTNRLSSSIVINDNPVLANFRVRLSDGVEPADPRDGSGLDDTTVLTSNVIVTQDGRVLQNNIDYSFAYNATSDTVLLTPLSGIWEDDRVYTIAFNNRDHFRIEPKTGSQLSDGFAFNVTDRNRDSATFEFESGYTMQVPQTLTLVIPAAGGSLGGISDGESFLVQRTQPGMMPQFRIFEFDSNGVVTDNNLDGVPDNLVVPFSVASTPDQIANAVVTQLQRADIGLSPRNIGNGMVHMGSTAQHTVDTIRAPNLKVTGVNDGVNDGEFFRLDDGSKVVFFEFDNNNQLADADSNGQPDRPGARTIPFSNSQTNVEIAQSIVTQVAIAGVGLTPSSVGNGQVHLGGVADVHLITAPAGSVTLLGQPGVRSAFGIKIPTSAGRLRLTNDNTGLPFISDGQTFTISDGTSVIKFELDNITDGRTTAPNVRVPFSVNDSVSQFADRLVAAIQSAPLAGLTPRNAGNGVVLLGEAQGTSSYFIDASQSGLRQVGSSGVPAAVPVVVRPHAEFDASQVAVSVIHAIDGSGLAVDAQPGGGDVVIVNDATGIPGTSSSFNITETNPVFDSRQLLNGIKDLAGNPLKPNLLTGDTQMTIVLGSPDADFGDAPQVNNGAYPTEVGFNGPIHMVTDRVLKLGRRVDAEPDGLVSANSDGDDRDSLNFPVSVAGTPNMTSSSPQTPTILTMPQPFALTVPAGGGATVRDGELFLIANGIRTATFELDSNNTLSNPNSIRVQFSPSSTADQIAEAITSAVRQANLGLTPLNLGGGKVHVGGSNIVVQGTLTVSGIANPVRDGQFFTIDVPGSPSSRRYTFEYEDTNLNDGVVQGNLPVRFSVASSQQDLVNAVIGAILDAQLGIAATDFTNGQIELNGDDDDGVVMGAFNPQTVTQVLVTASAAGLLDGWIDFNRDGDFEDVGEQIFASKPVTAGENAFQVSTPSTAVFGSTVGRFRLSSAGGLRPTGLAADGEVEDHVVQIVAGNPPIARDDGVAPSLIFASEDGLTSVGVSVLNNDTDADPGDTAILTVQSFSSVSKLGATINVNTSNVPATKGRFTYDPTTAPIVQSLDVGQTMTDTFTYRAQDALFLSAPATVTITIQGANDAPIAVNDTSIFTNQSRAIDIDVLLNDSDPEGHTLTLVAASGARGLVSVNSATRKVHYNPNGAFNNLNVGQTDTDTFTYQISDGRGGLAVGTVVVTVEGLNDAPNAVNDTTARTNEGASVIVNVLANDSDPEGSPIRVTTVDLTLTKGLVTINSLGQPNNSVTYNPNGQFESLGVGKTGTDTFVYTVEDAQGNASTATVTVTIDGRNDTPTAVNDGNNTVARNDVITINVLGNDRDIDGDTLVVNSVTKIGVQGTIISINPNNTVTYNPNRQFDTLRIGESRTDRFTYTINDGQGGAATATVTVTVIGASDPPVANNDTASTNEDSEVTISVLFNDTDDFGPLTVTAVNTSGIQGVVIINPVNRTNNAVVYSPNSQFDYLRPGQTATEVFTYTVSDGIGTDEGTVTVTVTGVNDAPVANVDPNGYRVIRRGTLNANDRTGTATPGNAGDDGVLLNDTDAEQDALSTVLVTQPQRASAFTLRADGTFTYVHDGSSANIDSFAYQARDTANARSAQVVTVVITIAPAPPPDWQNPLNRFDVNNDGSASPIDVLLMINYINDGLPATPLPLPRPTGAPFYDVNGDGSLTALDVLDVITNINDQNSNQASGEGEGFDTASDSLQLATAPLYLTPLSVATPAARSLAFAPSQPAAATTAPAASLRRAESAEPVSAPTSATNASDETVRLDLFGIDDILSDLAADFSHYQPGLSPLDELLAEMLG